MKIKLTRIVSTTLIFAVCIAVSRPGVVFADNHAGKRSDNGKGAKMSTVNFCTNITTLQTQTFSLFDTKMGDHAGKIKGVDALKPYNNQKKDFTVQVTKLKEKYTTPAQIAAIDAFKAEVDKALTDRKTAIDAITVSVKSEIDKLTSTSNTNTVNLIANAKTEIQKIFDTAKQSCSKGVDEKIVKKDLKDALQKIHTSVKQDKNTAKQSVNPQVKDLILKKKKDIQAVEKNFKDRVQKAKEGLNKALGK